MTTITGTARDASGAGVVGVTVTARLVASSEQLTAGGQVIRAATTVTAAGGAWSLTLTPITALAYPVGAYYRLEADGRRWTITVPPTGSYELGSVLVTPPEGRAETGATTSALTALATRVTNVETVDAAAGVGSLRTLGTGAQQAVAGNDVRLAVIPLAAVKTAAYTASVGELVQVDVTGRSVTDAAVTASSATLTSATAAFTAADVGRTLSIQSRWVPTGTTIASFQSATSVTMSANAVATTAGTHLTIIGSAQQTLPASAPAGSVVQIKKVDSTPHAVTIVPSAGDDIDGLSSVNITGRNVTRTFRKGTGVSWIADGGLTPVAGPASLRYDRVSNVYLPSDTCLQLLKAAIGRARSGVGAPAKILCKGDSTTLGILGSGGNGGSAVYNPNNVTNAQLISWPERVWKGLTLSNILGGKVGEGTIWSPNTDNRFTLGAGWTAGWGASSGIAGNFTFADDNQSDAYDLLIQKSSSTATTFTVTIDAAAPVTVNVTAQTTSTTAVYRVAAPTVGTHSVVISPPAAGSISIAGITPVNTVAPPIAQISRSGTSGESLATFLSGASTGTGGRYYNTITIHKPDAVLLMEGINDMHGYVSGPIATDVATYRTNLVSFVTGVQSINADPVLMVWPSRGYAGQSPSDYEALLYHQVIYDVADQYNVAVLDLQRRWGYGWRPVNYTPVGGVNPTPMYDGTHPTLMGYADIAAMVERFLGNVC